MLNREESMVKQSANVNAAAGKRNRRAPNWKLIWLTAGMALAVLGGVAWWSKVSNPPKPWLVRWRVTRFLKGQTDRGNFKIDFAFPTPEQMAKAPPKKASEAEALTKGKLTGKDFNTLKSDYIKLESGALVLERKMEGGRAGLEADLKAKEEALAPILSDLWDFQRAWLEELGRDEASGSAGLNRARTELMGEIRRSLGEAANYSQIYRAIGEELWVAQRLFSSANPEHRREGVRLALQASQIAEEDAQNGWLAGRIIEGYIWPHLDVANDRNPRSFFNLENLLTECATIFRRNEEWPSLARNYELLMTLDPQRADWARGQIGLAYEQAGEARLALNYLKAIKATNDYRGIMKRIPRLERQLKGS